VLEQATLKRERSWKEFNAMQAAEDFLRTMIDKIPTLAWSCWPDGTTEFLNQRWLDYTGLSMDEALGWGWKASIHSEDLGKLMDTWLRLLASGESGQEEARLRRFDGEYRWFLFRAVPVRDDRGKVVRWYGTNTDIEDLKRAEEKLRQSETELRQLIDAVPQHIFVLGADGDRLYSNEVAR
jgi:PAS domain S-box-containing protein